MDARDAEVDGTSKLMSEIEQGSRCVGGRSVTTPAWWRRSGVGLVLLCLSLMPLAKHSAPATVPTTDRSITDTPTPEALVARMREVFHRLMDYTCRLVERNFKHTEAFSESDYAFKKPRLIKLVGRTGRAQGAVVVLGTDGKLRLRKNGFPIPTFLVREALQDFAHSDFGSLIDEIHRLLMNGAPASVLTRGDAYALRLVNGRTVRLYVVDAKLGLPVELIAFEDGIRVSLTEWRDLRLDVGLTEEMFHP